MDSKPYVTMEEVIASQGENRKSYKFLTAANGCTNGCCSGITIYSDTEFNPNPGAHEDQEGFYVLEGEGYAWLDGEEYPIKAGDSFVALAGVKHTIRTSDASRSVKVFWFHSAV